ncbi:hypothetical protein VYU27_008971, partial [Nannochloropsis oceanica]
MPPLSTGPQPPAKSGGLLKELSSLFERGKYSLFFQHLSHHSVHDRSALQAILESSSSSFSSSSSSSSSSSFLPSLPLLLARALHHSLPFLDPALDQTLSSFFNISTSFFTDDDYHLLCLVGLSSSLSLPPSLSLPLALLDMVVSPSSSFRLRRYAFHFFFSFLQHPTILPALILTTMPEEDEKEDEDEEGKEGRQVKKGGRGRPPKRKKVEEGEGERGKEEGRKFLHKMHALFRGIFSEQLATIELQEGVMESAWRWMRGVEKEERRRGKRKMKERNKEGGSVYLLEEVLPVEVRAMIEEEKAYRPFLRRLPTCLQEGNARRRREREGGREGMVLAVVPKRVRVTSEEGG